MSESSILSDFERICKVIDVLYDDPTYSPLHLKRQYDNDFNPTHDGQVTKILKIERAWDWRDRVYNSFRCALPKDCTQMAHFAHKGKLQRYFCQRFDPRIVHGWIPFERRHCWAFWSYYWNQEYIRELDRAVKIVCRNFDRWRVWGEEE